MSVRDLERYTKQFIQKAVQVIVQSRLGSERIKTECNRNGTDWFSLAVPDIGADVTEQTKKAIETLNGSDELNTSDGSADIRRSFSLASKWRLCLEISLKTTDGETMILEYWFITNEAIEKSEVASSPTKPTPSTEVFDIYNKMSLMLRSLITMARATPAYKISSSGQSAESYVICYRVYQSDYSIENILGANEAKHYTSETKLGTISSKLNRLTVSIVWRTDMVCTTPSNSDRIASSELMPVKNDHFNKDHEQQQHQSAPINSTGEVSTSLRPLMAAFASSSPSSKLLGDALPHLPENAFSTLLITNDEPDSFNNGTGSTLSNAINGSKNMESNGSGGSSSSLVVTHSESKPIKIPEPKVRKKFPDLPGSPGGCSSGDSDFVIVDLKAPFASQDQQELGSFFTGPAPSFTGSGDLTEELCDFPSHIANFESTIEQLDSFVDSICTDPED